VCSCNYNDLALSISSIEVIDIFIQLKNPQIKTANLKITEFDRYLVVDIRMGTFVVKCSVYIALQLQVLSHFHYFTVVWSFCRLKSFKSRFFVYSFYITFDSTEVLTISYNVIIVRQFSYLPILLSQLQR